MHGFGFMPFMGFKFFGGLLQISLFVLLMVGIHKLIFRGCRCIGKYNGCDCYKNCNCGEGEKDKQEFKNETKKSAICGCEERETKNKEINNGKCAC
jgi:hypothetical protein